MDMVKSLSVTRQSAEGGAIHAFPITFDGLPSTDC
jgi:hypothetical protein